MIELTEQPIDTQEVLRQVSSTQAGAVVLFLGTTREFTRGRRTLSLNYECYAGMAEKKLAAIGVSSAHRQDAFEAGKWLIDTLKEVVPIWKQENWADGTTEWVHPDIETSRIEPSPNKQPIDKAK